MWIIVPEIKILFLYQEFIFQSQKKERKDMHCEKSRTKRYRKVLFLEVQRHCNPY